jgi:predicted transcriptional regulator
MTQIVKSLDSNLDLNSQKLAEESFSKAARNASVENSSPTSEHKAARNASIDVYITGQVVEVPISLLGISEEHLVRPINYQHVDELVQSDENEWEPIEFRLWPASWVKPHPDVKFHVMSGNHRRKSADAKKMEVIRGRYIKADSELEYLEAAIRTNTRHGLNFAEDEKRANAARLKELGMSGAQIAKLFGVHKSTVNNWLSGRDTNASRKQKIEPESIPDESYKLMPRETIMSSGKRKIMSLLINAQINADIEEAKAYVQTLKATQKDVLHHLVEWLQEVMEG